MRTARRRPRVSSCVSLLLCEHARSRSSLRLFSNVPQDAESYVMRASQGRHVQKREKALETRKTGTEQGKKAQALSLPLAGLTASALAPAPGNLMSSSSSSSSAESLDLYGIVSGISSATLYESASAAAFASASATEDWPETSSSSRSPAPSPSADARRRDAEADPGRDETTGEDIGRRPRASPREARAKVGRVRSRRRIGEYPRTGRARAWAPTRSAGARRMADRAVAIMSRGGGIPASEKGRVDWRARFAGNCDAPGALRVALALSLFGHVRELGRDRCSPHAWTVTFSTNAYAAFTMS